MDVLILSEELGPGAVKGQQGDVTLPFREPSRFSIGDPVVLPVGDDADSAGEITAQRDRYDFHEVQLTCSFGAAPACRFADARFEVVLETESDTPDVPDGAIAYDLFPQLLEDATTVTITKAWKPELSFKFNQASGTLSLPSRQRVEEQVSYTSRVEAFDLRGNRPAWSFRRTDQHEISGPQRLFMLLRTPKRTHVRAAFSLRARVEFVLGGRGLAPVELVMLFRRRNETGTLEGAPTVVLC